MKRQHYQPEWETFTQNARRFDDELPEKRYGIVNPSVTTPSSGYDMLWASDPRTLHELHYDNYPSIKLRDHLDNLEIMDGKRHKGHSSLIHKQ